MTLIWIGEGSEGTCAGAPIKSATYLFSNDLLASCEYFSSLAQEAKDPNHVRYLNTACVMASASYVEARLNEDITTYCALSSYDDAGEDLTDIASSLKNLNLVEKWNLFTEKTGGTKWNKGAEPFQSHQVIVSLRNELVHYKGSFFSKDETPTKKIKHLMRELKVESSATFIEDDASVWVLDLLVRPELSNWIISKTKAFAGEISHLLHKN